MSGSTLKKKFEIVYFEEKNILNSIYGFSLLIGLVRIIIIIGKVVQRHRLHH